MTEYERQLIEDLIETALGYASYTCSEFCAHSIDKPESCPMNDEVIAEAKAYLELVKVAHADD